MAIQAYHDDEPRYTLDELVALIQQLYKKHGIQVRLSMESGILLGEYYNRCKELVKARYGPGNWEAWAKEHLPQSPSTRQLYMDGADNRTLALQAGDWNTWQRISHEIKKLGSKKRRRERIEEAKWLLHQKKLPIEQNWQVHHADCTTFAWQGLCDFIWTDPLWLQKNHDYRELKHYEWLAGFAGTHLREGGLLSVQTNQTSFDKVMPIFKDFRYISELCINYPQAANKIGNCLICNHKPILLWSKGEWDCPKGCATDCYTVRTDKKLYHEYEQPLEPMCLWISELTKPGQLGFDPFCCTGTNLVAMKKTCRRGIGTEIEEGGSEGMVAVARQRLKETIEGDWLAGQQPKV